jgi:hypothetical protein
MKTVEISHQLEKVLNLVVKGSPLNLMEIMEVSIFVEELKKIPHELGIPEYRAKYSWINKK